MKKSVKAHKISDKGQGRKLLSSSLFGICIGFICMLALLIIFSAICLAIPNPHPLIFPLCLFSIYSSAFFSGFSAVKRNGGRDALLCGSLTGVAYMMIFWLVFATTKFMLKEEGAATLSFILKLLLIPTALAGAFSGLKGNTPVKPKRKR